VTAAERAIFEAAVRFVTADEEFRERYADWIVSDRRPGSDAEREVMRLSSLVQEALADLRRAVLDWQAGGSAHAAAEGEENRKNADHSG
jgi:hypothetical protein